MSQSSYIEDIFLEFYSTILVQGVVIQHQDRTAASSFYTTISNGNALTKNQGNYILRILEKYKNTMADIGVDYIEDIKNPQWAQPFRVIDMSKKVFVETDNEKNINVCLKFPYQLLEAFDVELFPTTNESARAMWHPERKIRTVNIYEANLIHIYEFCKKYEFEIDETFMIALSEVEEIWQNQEDILPRCTVFENQVILKNVNEETQQWFDNNKNGNVNNDLFLAKSMGLLYDKKPITHLERIASTNTNMFFWKHNTRELFEMCLDIEGKIAIIMDRSQDGLDWIEQITSSAEAAGYKNTDIKVGFRTRANDESNFNEWVANKGYGGKMLDGKIYIFNHKPPKWLFKDNISVKMLITNALIPASTRLTREWISSHPCVVFANEFEPTPYSEVEIGKL